MKGTNLGVGALSVPNYRDLGHATARLYPNNPTIDNSHYR